MFHSENRKQRRTTLKTFIPSVREHFNFLETRQRQWRENIFLILNCLDDILSLVSFNYDSRFSIFLSVRSSPISTISRFTSGSNRWQGMNEMKMIKFSSWKFWMQFRAKEVEKSWKGNFNFPSNCSTFNLCSVMKVQKMLNEEFSLRSVFEVENGKHEETTKLQQFRMKN